MNFLDKENIPYDKKAKKSELETIYLEQAPDKIEENFQTIFYASIPTKYSAKNIHFYLHRKYDSELFYDEDMNFIEIPLLDTDLPDDFITDQLIKRGYYVKK